MERMLDDCHGSCVLRYAVCRGFVEKTLRHGDGAEYRLGDFVIMPNHVHLLVLIADGRALSVQFQAWKSVSAHQIGEEVGRSGRVWQAEPFDHIVRGPEHWERFVRYIRMNPAGVPAGEYTLGCGTLVWDGE